MIKRIENKVVREIVSIVLILILVGVFRSFVSSPYSIPSRSMVPTMLVGDSFFATKFNYNFKIPYTNISYKVGEASRGDVVVFDFPKDRNITFIKRVIGVPGDVIKTDKDSVYINGIKLKTKKVVSSEVEHVIETINGVEHEIMPILSDRYVSGEWVVPEDSYFVMGDNRGNSLDSRYWGFVPQSHLIGKAQIIHYSYGDGFRWGRIFSLIE